MPSTLELRRRIKSVKSTKQITKAMELVSASKMRRASQATLASRPYSQRIWKLVQDILRHGPENATHPLLNARPVKNVRVLVLSSDQGLAGIYDGAIIKQAHQFAVEQEKLKRKVTFTTMGRRAEHALTHLGYTIVQSYPHINGQPAPHEAWPLSMALVHGFLDGEFDEAYVIYTSFISLLRQQATMQKVLPLIAMEPEPDEEPLSAYSQFLYEPSPAEVLDKLLPRLVEVQIFQALLESLASEHAARRLAMKNATDNASDMIDDLTLTYNGVRQSAITQELAEITSGAAALENVS